MSKPMMDDAQTDAPKILPCPFCGGVGKLGSLDGRHSVRCQDCYGRGRESELPAVAITEWNRRAALASPRAPEGEQTMREWVIERWDAEVANRPLANIHRRTLDNTWRQVYRWLTDEELPRPKQESAVHRSPDWRDSMKLDPVLTWHFIVGKSGLPAYSNPDRDKVKLDGQCAFMNKPESKWPDPPYRVLTLTALLDPPVIADWRDSEAVKVLRHKLRDDDNGNYMGVSLRSRELAYDALCDAVAEYVQSHARPSKGE